MRSIRGSSVTENRFEDGDVVWAPDPYSQGSNPRLWLVLATDSLPYVGEEYLCAALTTSDLPDNYEVDDDWIRGRDPSKTSYCSPWVLATVKDRAIANPQGAVTDHFVERVRSASKQYLDG